MALMKFAKWLRSTRSFPVRVTAYLTQNPTVKTVHGEVGVASFYGPWTSNYQPFIRIATGDYPELRKELGRDNALASILTSFAHEIVHYDQWLSDRPQCEKEAEEEAGRLLWEYEETTDRP